MTSALTSLRLIFASMVVKRTVFQDIGFFDSTRWGSDAEFLSRVQVAFGGKAVRELREELYFARLIEGSLTTSDYSRVFKQDGSSVKSSMSEARKQYRKNFEEWHQSAASFRDLYIPFPQATRVFPLASRLQAAELFSPDTSINLDTYSIGR